MSDLISRSALLKQAQNEKNIAHSKVQEGGGRFWLGVRGALNWCIGKLNDAPSVDAVSGEWISVKDRLPNEDGQYLVVSNLFGKFQLMEILSFAKKYNGYEQHLCGKTIWYDNDSEYGDVQAINVTHWMQLPEVPKNDT